jgi:PA26 p53-induced protein (sestrin)
MSDEVVEDFSIKLAYVLYQFNIQRKHVEIPSLVNESPSWLIPLNEIIGFKTDHHDEVVTVQVQDKYISNDSSSESDTDIPFRSRTPDIEFTNDGYSYYTSPDATPRPQFTTPAIPINAPPRSRSRTRHLSRNTSQESIVQAASVHSERKFVRQHHASNDIRKFQIDSFEAHGRVTNYAKVLFFMPRYIRCTSTCYEKLVSSTRGIPRPIKTFIALLAAAESGCQYFVSYFTTKYLEVAGDSNWLKGIEDTPEKVQRIAGLNRRLIAVPWNVTGRDVTALMDTGDFEEPEDGWSVGDVVQMMTILGIFHAQSAIALATGVVCEADVFGGTIWRKISRGTPEVEGSEETLTNGNHGARDGRQEIIDKLRMKALGSGHISPDMSFDNLQALQMEGSRREDAAERTAKAAFLECLGYDTVTADSDDTPVNPIIEDLSRFTINPDTPRNPTFPTTHPILHITDHTWDSIMQVLQTHLPELATNLDKRFHLPPTPTFLQHDDTDLDITPFRDALHYYSLALLGIMRDTFDYKLIGEFLDDRIRQFVRRISLDPRGMMKADWEGVKAMGFTDAEMVEIVVMICEARFMGVLIYAFKAVGGI